jgi:hypothetical protein
MERSNCGAKIPAAPRRGEEEYGSHGRRLRPWVAIPSFDSDFDSGLDSHGGSPYTPNRCHAVRKIRSA